MIQDQRSLLALVAWNNARFSLDYFRVDQSLDDFVHSLDLVGILLGEVDDQA